MHKKSYLSAGREQISQDGVFRLSHPRFVNNDYATAEIIYSTAQWTSQGTCLTTSYFVLQWYVSSTQKAAASLLHHSCVCWVNHERRELWYGCCVSQERRNVSWVPTLPWVFFQPLSLCLSSPGFSLQWDTQQDNWRHEQHQWYTE